MRTPLPLTHSTAARAVGWSPGLAHWKALFHLTKERRQVLLDKLAVFAVFLLILATVTLFGFYVAHELPQWRAGQIGGFETLAAPTPQGNVPSADPVSSAQAPILSRVPLVLISMAIELAIFVGLGLYLRHEMNRMP